MASSEEDYLSLLSPENREFIMQFEIKQQDKYYKVLKQSGNPAHPIFIIESNDQPGIKKILKKINLKGGNFFDLNMIIDSFRSTYDFTSLQGKYKCYSKRYICYTDMFISGEKDDHSFCYVYDRIPGHDLFDWIIDNYGTYINRLNSKKGISLKYLVTIAYQLFSSLSILHYHGIYHRDIKPENIIINEKDGNIQLTLIDFDFGCNVKSCKGSPGSPAYAAALLFTKEANHMSSIRWNFCDSESAALSILRLYSQDFDNMVYNKTSTDFTQNFKDCIEKETQYRKSKNYFEGDDEVKFIQKMISFSFISIYGGDMALDMVKFIEKELGDYVSDNLKEEFAQDFKFYEKYYFGESPKYKRSRNYSSEETESRRKRRYDEELMSTKQDLSN
jgi:hypothetical protein